MAGALISLIMLLIMALIVIVRQHNTITDLEDKIGNKDAIISELHRWTNFYRERSQESCNNVKIIREVPKGTVQAVKMAMKLSHPDNGGKEVDFIMYRRAYNILTGKEKP